ncbi:hypothetical protein ACFQ2M_35720 [Kitasatospora saccharophila]|uniref:hypothetical protein n=1 Tax=Kitasatospora saccharophila TaxID=407973 RepID=UPI0036379E70
MAAWCRAAGVRLAPHGKTTMAPALWQAQLAAGAHAITLANLPQLRVARAFGVQRLLLANTLLDPAGLAWIAAELDRDPGFAFASWVDSADSVRQMDAALRAAGARRPVEVLVELGGPGGRTGARGVPAALEVAAAVLAAPTLRLAGVGGYEGALAHDASDPALAAVRGYLADLADLHRRLATDYPTGTPVVTAGGSAYFDTVAEELTPSPGRSPAPPSSSGPAPTSPTTTASTAASPRSPAPPTPPRCAPPCTAGPGSSPTPNPDSPCSTPGSATSRSTRACPNPNSSAAPAR